MAPEEARRQAQMAFGGVERVKEEVRDVRWETRFDNFVRDFRYALRNLAKDRAFAIIGILTLAIGIAASTVAFSAFYNLLFHAFRAKDQSRPRDFDGIRRRPRGEIEERLFSVSRDTGRLRSGARENARVRRHRRLFG